MSNKAVRYGLVDLERRLHSDRVQVLHHSEDWDVADVIDVVQRWLMDLAGNSRQLSPLEDTEHLRSMLETPPNRVPVPLALVGLLANTHPLRRALARPVRALV